MERAVTADALRWLSMEPHMFEQGGATGDAARLEGLFSARDRGACAPATAPSRRCSDVASLYGSVSSAGSSRSKLSKVPPKRLTKTVRVPSTKARKQKEAHRAKSTTRAEPGQNTTGVRRAAKLRTLDQDVCRSSLAPITDSEDSGSAGNGMLVRVPVRGSGATAALKERAAAAPDDSSMRDDDDDDDGDDDRDSVSDDYDDDDDEDMEMHQQSEHVVPAAAAATVAAAGTPATAGAAADPAELSTRLNLASAFHELPMPNYGLEHLNPAFQEAPANLVISTAKGELNVKFDRERTTLVARFIETDEPLSVTAKALTNLYRKSRREMTMQDATEWLIARYPHFLKKQKHIELLIMSSKLCKADVDTKEGRAKIKAISEVIGTHIKIISTIQNSLSKSK